MVVHTVQNITQWVVVPMASEHLKYSLGLFRLELWHKGKSLSKIAIIECDKYGK